ncbi:MAG: hypothetical protein FJ403_16525 [Verrucomicrobia bacterium]|nr:hypothetical protein [Verrucomicrobiota bacterium]
MRKQILLSLITFTSLLDGQCQTKLDKAFQLLRGAVDTGEVPGYLALVARRNEVLGHEARGLCDIENNILFTTNTL